MPVVNVGKVRMRMLERRMRMLVSMRLAGGVARRVRMLMVRIVDVAMAVRQRLVRVNMLMALGEV